MAVLRRDKLRGFTLIELLVVIAIITLLVSILFPSLTRARFLANKAKVMAELRGIDSSLRIYYIDHECYPPVRTDCIGDMRGHEYQLPVELAYGGYLPHGASLQTMVAVEDPFNPDHTYKYNTPGPIVRNKAFDEDENYFWVPDNFPWDPGDDLTKARGEGTLYNHLENCPVHWAIWSVGPAGPDSPKALSQRCPASSRTWYDPSDGQGIICRILTADGLVLLSP